MPVPVVDKTDRHLPATGIKSAAHPFARPPFRRSDIRGSHRDMTVATTRNGIRTVSDELGRKRYILPANSEIQRSKNIPISLCPGQSYRSCSIATASARLHPLSQEQEPAVCGRSDRAGMSLLVGRVNGRVAARRSCWSPTGKALQWRP